MSATGLLGKTRQWRAADRVRDWVLDVVEGSRWPGVERDRGPEGFGLERPRRCLGTRSVVSNPDRADRCRDPLGTRVCAKQSMCPTIRCRCDSAVNRAFGCYFDKAQRHSDFVKVARRVVSVSLHLDSLLSLSLFLGESSSSFYLGLSRQGSSWLQLGGVPPRTKGISAAVAEIDS